MGIWIYELVCSSLVIGDSTEIFEDLEYELVQSLRPGLGLDKIGIQGMLWLKQLAQSPIPISGIKKD